MQTVLRKEVSSNCVQRSSIGAVGVRLCSSAQLAMPLEFMNLNLLGSTKGSGQPLTAAWLCFKAEICLSGPHCRQCRCCQQCCLNLDVFKLFKIASYLINSSVSNAHLFKQVNVVAKLSVELILKLFVLNPYFPNSTRTTKQFSANN